MSAALSIERLGGLAALEAFAPEWQALCDRARPAPPCNEPCWVLPYLRAWPSPHEPFALVARDAAGVAQALLPLRREASRGWWALRRLAHAADGSFDSEALQPVIAPGAEQAGAEALADGLAAERGADALMLFCAPDGESAVQALGAAFDRRGWPLRRVPLAYLAAPLGGSLEETLQELKPRMRSKVRAALRSIEAAGAHARFVEDARELDAALDALFELHGARWRAEGRPGSFGDARRRDFYRAIAAGYLRQGRLRLALLELGGRPVAAQLGIRSGTVYTQVQEGFLPDVSWRPGTALRAWALSQLIDSGVRTCDFQEGDAPHKRDWGAIEKPAHTLVVGLPRLRARLEFALRERLGR
jgi:CelD/BcsL family acetyltransferase involved in cellulose biosynthesis